MEESYFLYRLLYRERLRARRGAVPEPWREPPRRIGAWLGRNITRLAWAVGERWARPRRPFTPGILKTRWRDLWWQAEPLPMGSVSRSYTHRY
jgi:hypothetical protein